MIHVHAIITAKPGMLTDLLAAFEANVPLIRAMPGCAEYTHAVDVEDGGAAQTKVGADSFVVIERWETMELFNEKGGSAAMTAYRAKSGPMIAGRVIHILKSS